MASRSLRLLSSSNESNQPCLLTNCDPFLSPPPPPDSIPIDVHHRNRLLPNFLIAAASLLAFSFLLLVLFYSLLRLRRRRRRRSSLAANPHPPPPPHQDPDDDDLLVDDAIHHVWFIRTVGLDESLIKAIPAAAYKSGNSDGDHCSVCLGEFRDGESVKLLPKCAHVFHVDCIDTWLRSHVNCPLCRAAVVAVAAPASVGDSESTRIEIGDGNQDARFDAADVGNLTAGSSSSSSSSSSSGRIENGNGCGNDLQPIRRSVSMDASSLGVIMLRAESESEEGMLGDGRRAVKLTAVGVCKDGGGKGDDDGDVGKLGSELKRSMSSRSGRFFFPTYGRGRVMNGGRS